MTPSIQSHIERLMKATEFDPMSELETQGTSARAFDYVDGKRDRNNELTPILRAYEAVIKIQAEALELYADVGLPENDFIEKCLEQAMAERAADNVTINLGGLHISKKAREAIASVEKILVEVK